jgi:hypothetical protein
MKQVPFDYLPYIFHAFPFVFGMNIQPKKHKSLTIICVVFVKDDNLNGRQIFLTELLFLT